MPFLDLDAQRHVPCASCLTEIEFDHNEFENWEKYKSFNENISIKAVRGLVAVWEVEI